jgi:tRNA pseudouridine38-40 synthase
MERYQIILAYDGTDFHGSQIQKDTRTVQTVLEIALRKLGWVGRSILFAGRTDAGVHASGQVAAFDLKWEHSLHDLRNALNSLLPTDAAVREVFIREHDFHPRFDATARTYRYRIYCDEVRQPLLSRYFWRVWPRPDNSLLDSTALLFLGVHDFAGFGRPTQAGGSTIRNITSIEWQRKGDELILQVTGNAFLYHMVRRIVFSQVMVGQGKLDMDIISQYLNNPMADPLQGLAPARGLSLVEVTYPGPGGENN